MVRAPRARRLKKRTPRRNTAQRGATGISQVGDAVTQLDGVTQQNAALVEESAAAAERLKHQAMRLNAVVNRFTLAPQR